MRVLFFVALLSLLALSSATRVHTDVADLLEEQPAMLESGVGNFVISQSQLATAAKCSSATAANWLAPIRSAAAKYGITTAKRMAGFLAQVGHESGSLSIVLENMNYSEAGLLATFPKYFTKERAKQYARQPQKIGSRVYANRMGNGNEASGEGFKYRGRGLIQITGKSQYDRVGKALGLNLISNPDLLTERLYAAMSAGWFWSTYGLNAVADRGDITAMTRIINGGTNGLADRRDRYTIAKRALGVA